MSVASNQHLSLVKTTSIISRNCIRKNNRPPKFLDLASKNLSFLALYVSRVPYILRMKYSKKKKKKKKRKRSEEEARETELKNKITEEKK